MKNKMSIWAVIILIATIISLVLLVTEIVFTAIGIPAATEAAKQAAEQEAGGDQAAIELAVGIAIGAIIVILVFSSLFDVLKIIGGFLFSLKGRWGMFCIIVNIISLAFGLYNFINDLTKGANAANIVTHVLGLAISVLLVVACFKHRAELRGA